MRWKELFPVLQMQCLPCVQITISRLFKTGQFVWKFYKLLEKNCFDLMIYLNTGARKHKMS